MNATIEPQTSKFTPEQEAQLRSLKAHFPYRIIWGEIDKATGTFEAIASFDRRELNKSLRAGNIVAALG